MIPVPGFTCNALTDWARAALAPGSRVHSDGLACFAGVIAAGCQHRATIIGPRKPKEVPEFGWVNTLLGNLKTGFSGAYHAFKFLPGRLRLSLQPALSPRHLSQPPARRRHRHRTATCPLASTG
ncbi:MAG: transposase [Candidatus Competibacter sp.]|nr:transposase [Candidatus Competibacter sp.]